MKRILISFFLSTFIFSGMSAQYADCYRDTPISIKQAELPRILDRSVDVRDYGAVGDGLTLCTEAIQKAIDDVASKGGGHVVVPSGIWLVTSIELKSCVDLHLDRNALIQQTFDKTKYQLQPDGRRFYPCIYGTGLHDISVTGEGAVDGAGKYWRPVKRAKMSDFEWDTYIAMGGTLEENGKLWMPYNLNNVENVTDATTKEEALRSDMFRPEKCDRLLVKGVTFQNSPRFTVHPCFCTNVVIDDVKVRSPWNVQNADGIDLSNCKIALVINCFVDCGDDGLCLKSGIGENGLKAGPCQDILIQDCKVAHAHGGFVLGSDIAGGMDRIVVRRCMFSNTDIGLRFKSAAGRGGTTSNMFIQDIVMTDIVNEAIMFNCGYADNRYSAASAEKSLNIDSRKIDYAPNFQNIIMERVTCREAKTAVKAYGIEGLKCIHDITVKNSTFFYRETPTDIDKNTASVNIENVKFDTFDVNNIGSELEKEVNSGSYVETNDNGYLQLKKELPIKLFRVDASHSIGPDGTIYYTCLKIRSKSNPDFEIEYGYYMNKNHKGRLTINGNPVDNIGNALHDGYIYYNLTPYANDLYIWGVQNNFPVKEFIYN